MEWKGEQSKRLRQGNGPLQHSADYFHSTRNVECTKNCTGSRLLWYFLGAMQSPASCYTCLQTFAFVIYVSIPEFVLQGFFSRIFPRSHP